MGKEKIELFAQKRLPPPADAGRTGGGAVRILALGMALFSVIFILCCVGVGLRAGEHGPDSINPSKLGNLMERVAAAMRSFPARDSTEETDGTNSQSPSPDTSAPTPTQKELYAYDPSGIPAAHTPIRPYDMSLHSYGEDFIYNNTTYSPNTGALLALSTLPRIADTSSSPVVLIIHTHGTEAYSPEGSLSYDGVSTLARSENTEENVVAVGRVMAAELNRLGVNTLHCEVMHDAQSYRDSYARSAATINEYLRKYPTIKYVFDVHRDSVTDSSGALLRPVTLANGHVAAQVMCVVGSDAGGTTCPRWQENLSFALRLRAELNGDYGSLGRPVCLRTSAYNQQYAPVSLLLEVGASGNYLSEALEAGRLCAGVLARMIKGN